MKKALAKSQAETAKYKAQVKAQSSSPTSVETKLVVLKEAVKDLNKKVGKLQEGQIKAINDASDVTVTQDQLHAELEVRVMEVESEVKDNKEEMNSRFAALENQSDIHTRALQHLYNMFSRHLTPNEEERKFFNPDDDSDAEEDPSTKGEKSKEPKQASQVDKSKEESKEKFEDKSEDRSKWERSTQVYQKKSQGEKKEKKEDMKSTTVSSESDKEKISLHDNVSDDPDNFYTGEHIDEFANLTFPGEKTTDFDLSNWEDEEPVDP